MGLTNKEVILLNFEYQTYLTYISVIWIVAISLFVGIVSYMIISINILSKNFPLLIILSLILIFIEIAFISIYFLINRKKENIEKRVEENKV